MPGQSEPKKYRDLLLHSDEDYEPYGLSYTSSLIEMRLTAQDHATITVYGEYRTEPGTTKIKA